MEDNGADENTLKAGESFHILYFFLFIGFLLPLLSTFLLKKRQIERENERTAGIATKKVTKFIDTMLTLTHALHLAQCHLHLKT